MIQLHTLHSKNVRRARKIRGRGDASGRGSYSGRGRKGQRARAGGTRGLTYLGLRRVMLSTPKLRGFRSLYAKPVAINVSLLEERWKGEDMVTPDSLVASGIISRTTGGVKILGDGVVTKKLHVKGCKVSAAAKEKILKAGGAVQ